MRTRLVAVAALALFTILVPTARAGCASITDPVADVTVEPGAVPVVDTHVDIQRATLQPTTTGLAVTITDTALVPARLGLWRLTFTSRRTRLYVSAGLGMWANFGDGAALAGFRAGVVDRTRHVVTGKFDYLTSTVSVNVPYSAFGSALPRGTATLTDVAVEAHETIVNDAPTGTPRDVTLTDTAHAARLTIARC